MDRGQETTEVKHNVSKMSQTTLTGSVLSANEKLIIKRERNERNRDHLSTAFRVYKQLYGEEAAREAFIEIASNIASEDIISDGDDNVLPVITTGSSTDDSVSSTTANVDGPTAPRYLSYRQSLTSQKDKARLLDSSSHSSNADAGNKKRPLQQLLSDTVVSKAVPKTSSMLDDDEQSTEKSTTVTKSITNDADNETPLHTATSTTDDETSQAIASIENLSIMAIASNVAESNEPKTVAEFPRYIKYRASLSGKASDSSDANNIVRVGSVEETEGNINDLNGFFKDFPVASDESVNSVASTPTRYVQYRASLTQSNKSKIFSAFVPSESEPERQVNKTHSELGSQDSQKNDESHSVGVAIVRVGDASAGLFAAAPTSSVQKEEDGTTSVGAISASSKSSASPNRYMKYRSLLNNTSMTSTSSETEAVEKIGAETTSLPPSIVRSSNEGATAASILSDLNTAEKSLVDEKQVENSTVSKAATALFPSFAEQILGADSDDGMANSVTDQSCAGQSFADHSAVTQVISNSIHYATGQEKSQPIFLASDVDSSFDNDSNDEVTMPTSSQSRDLLNENLNTSDIVSVSSDTAENRNSNILLLPLIATSLTMCGNGDYIEPGIESSNAMANVAPVNDNQKRDVEAAETSLFSVVPVPVQIGELDQESIEVPDDNPSTNVAALDSAQSPAKTESSYTSDSDSSSSSSDDDSTSSSDSASGTAEVPGNNASLNTNYDNEEARKDFPRPFKYVDNIETAKENNSRDYKYTDNVLPKDALATTQSTPTETKYKDFDYGDSSADDRDIECSIVSNEKDNELEEKEQFKRSTAFTRGRCFRYVVLLCLLIGVPLGIGLAIVLSRDNNNEREVVPYDTTSPSLSPVQVEPTYKPTRVRRPTVSTKSPTITPTSQPVAALDTELFELLAGLSSDNGTAMSIVGTPQNEAYVWLSRDPSIINYTQFRKVQRYALSSFFLSTGGANWTSNTNWFTYTDECTWFSRSSRIPSCDENGEYNNLDLGYNDVSGSLPPEIGMLTQLSRVIISGGIRNTVIGALPTELGLLTRMGTFMLQGNSIYGKIPTELGNWSSVQTIDLSFNNIFGTIPTQIGKWKGLRFLALSSNRLEGQLPRTVNKLTNLERLSINDNVLTGTVPSTIASLASVKVLNLEQNLLTSLPIQIGNMSSLETLTAHENQLNSRFLTAVGKIQTLRRLILNRNSFTGPIPTTIGNITELRYLDLSFNNFNSTIPSELGQLSDILTLQLESNNLTGAIPVEFANLASASLIRIDQNNITGTVPDQVCTTFQAEFPTFYVDCGGGDDAEVICPDTCCTFCCTDGGGCECRFAGTPYQLLCYR